jgi:hypothetical protein
MPRSLSLKAYLALTRRESDRTLRHDPTAERPAGRLLWLHATRAEKAAALAGLGQRLMAQMRAAIEAGTFTAFRESFYAARQR